MSDIELDDQEECPMCGEQRVIAVDPGPPSMMGYGHDPDTVTLACGHRLTWGVFTGTPYFVREVR